MSSGKRVTLVENAKTQSPNQSNDKQLLQQSPPSISDVDNDKLVKKLMDKISIQAQELGELNTALESSSEYIEVHSTTLCK